MPRVVHFELYAEDPQRAVGFYQSVFGWKIEKWPGPMEYWLVTTGEEGEAGVDGAIGPRESGLKTNVVVDVASVDEVTEKVLASGGKVLTPKMPVPGVGYAAYYEDTEGVVFGVMQSDTEAK
jgi:predicted enzyme related to lactoylglutathione lyase